MAVRPHTLRLILGDQLNPLHSWFAHADAGVIYLLMEVRQETDYVRHHVQKVAGFFAAMRAFADHLRGRGHRVRYLRLDDPDNRQTIHDNLLHLVQTEGVTRLEYMLPDELRLDSHLRDLSACLPVACAAVDSEHFLTRRRDLAELFPGRGRFRMEGFYRWMRRRFNVLMEGGRPCGGSWNLDAANRQPYDGRVPIPPPLVFDNDVSGIVRMMRQCGVASIGAIEPRRLPWPIDRPQALRLLSAFVRDGLPHFGTYQDAMTLSSWSLFHSRLSFALNTKILNPLEVVNAALEAWRRDPQHIALPQIEGFVRQILGWREYMRGVYWALMPGLATMNWLGHGLPLPACYWTADTRMRCMAEAIGQSLTHAYAHHIQRLMVTGNFALLAGVHPDEVETWYLGIYIDAIQWVEMPNTRAMSQFADGGLVATKPYACSANYLRRMSDYCGACFYDPRRRIGGHACPFNALYWDFFARHRSRLEGNPRIGMVYRSWDRMGAGERRDIRQQADHLRANLDRL
jgi:deoxyribodipyrimidine photolyase-related protein